MSYILNENNFSEFTKKIVKNLKKENIEIKLSVLKDVISKSIGFNNFHCAKKENFNLSGSSLKPTNKIILSPFNKKYSQLDIIFNKRNSDNLKFEKDLTIVSCNALFAALSLFKNEPERYELNINDWINELVDRCGGYHEANNLFIFLMFIMEVRDSEIGSERDILGRLFIKKLKKEVPSWVSKIFFSEGLYVFKKECFNYHFDISYIDGDCEYDFRDEKSCLVFAEKNISWDLINHISLTIHDTENNIELFFDNETDILNELKRRCN